MKISGKIYLCVIQGREKQIYDEYYRIKHIHIKIYEESVEIVKINQTKVYDQSSSSVARRFVEGTYFDKVHNPIIQVFSQ